jgi:hypothetical protein
MQEKWPKKDPARRKRLAEALRTNLRRRKDKERALREFEKAAGDDEPRRVPSSRLDP